MKTAQTHTVLSSAASHCGDADSAVILDTLKYGTDIKFEILSVCSPKMVCKVKVTGGDGDVIRIYERE